MANTNAPFGLRPIGHLLNGDPQLSPYKIASEYNAALGRGDLVKLAGTSRNIVIAAAGDTNVIGVFAGVEYTNSDGQRVWTDYWTASAVGSNIVAYVWDDPFIIWEAQADTYAETDQGALCDIVVGTPSATNRRSTSYAQAGTTATNGKTLRIEGLVERPDNAVGAYAKIKVTFAEHARLTPHGATGGQGV
jgi:hypothetical protein